MFRYIFKSLASALFRAKLARLPRRLVFWVFSSPFPGIRVEVSPCSVIVPLCLVRIALVVALNICAVTTHVPVNVVRPRGHGLSREQNCCGRYCCDDDSLHCNALFVSYFLLIDLLRFLVAVLHTISFKPPSVLGHATPQNRVESIGASIINRSGAVVPINKRTSIRDRRGLIWANCRLCSGASIYLSRPGLREADCFDLLSVGSGRSTKRNHTDFVLRLGTPR